MWPGRRLLLALDALVNLLLGVVLLLGPLGTFELLGLPTTVRPFYATVLGGVLVGIGVALLLERQGSASGIRGLGLGGAIATNLCGGGVVLSWLVSGHLDLPARGRVLLWAVATVVLAVAIVELASMRSHRANP